jgi:plastocyanin
MSQPGIAADNEYQLTIQNHQFQPARVEVPANTRVKLIIHNKDATPEEFESHEMHREKIIAGNSQAAVFVGPLAPGEYPFFGEFHEDTAKGVLIVK